MANVKAELASIAAQLGWHGGKAVSVLLVGPPGTGKTRFASLLAKEFSKHLNTDVPFSAFVLPQTMPEEIAGVNVPNEDRTAVCRRPLELIRRLTLSKEGYGVALFDELTSAPAATGAATMTVASDGRAGDIELNDRVSRIFACNPVEQAASGRDLTPPEANRFCWINDWKISQEDYLDYLRGGKGLMSHVRIIPADFEQTHGMATRAWLSSFLSLNPSLKNQLESNTITPDAASKPWASERSWENAMRLLAAILALGENKMSELAYEAVTGCVGNGAGTAFMEWLRKMNLPDPEEFLRNPQGNKLPERSDELRVFLESLAVAASNPSKPDALKRWNTFWDIIDPIIKEKQDMAISACDIASKADIKGKTIPPTAAALFEVRRRAGLIGKKQ